MKRVSAILGAATFAALIGIIGLLLSGVQIGQTSQQAQSDDIANATMMAIESEQSQRLAAGATMVALQEKQLQSLEHNATIIAIQQRQLIAIEEMATLQATNPDDSATVTAVAERLLEIEATNESLELERERLEQATPLSPPVPKNCSLHSWMPTEITFVNRGEVTLFVYWINYQCEEEYFQTLPPGHQYIQQTFMTHPWVIRDPDGRLVNSYIATDAEPVTVMVP